ncbi:MAG TPA: ThiF family adenylyltransferase [Saprospiraceae bacterium]|nr:ThiF family adenylyltransferase [Saprospiraceae bacterium]HPB52485.1 ThiF family adenylyltransferase [Saprospiraceae bacterium]HQN56303.1 ThiF family adenylyltransferase [Saprospiraceae bacterium]HQP75878.1 ThiF family adenylyltransferase [Saprospiraceae bacterium]HRN32867.1 ThiF family adenylyltransferase [Saprospiraceae bacterium]
MAKPKTFTIQHEKPWDSTFQLMSWWDSEKVRKACVMVVGAGSLGNEVLKNLALMNVGKIIIIDFDRIESSNLNRSVLYRAEDAEAQSFKSEIAARKIMEINPNVRAIAINADITCQVGLGLFRRCDVIIGCLDNRLARLFINRYASRFNVAWIDGAIENLAGSMAVYRLGKNCYECGLSATEWQNIRYRLGCPDVASRNIKYGKIPTTPISASIIAAMQVQEAIKVIHGNEGFIEYAKKFYYEGMNNIAMWVESNDRYDECESHILWQDVIEDEALSHEMTIGEFFDYLEGRFENGLKINLDTELVLEITSQESEKSYDVAVLKTELTDDFLAKYRSELVENFLITRSLTCISRESGLNDYTLKSIGIPALAILSIETKDDVIYIELTKDILKYTILNN